MSGGAPVQPTQQNVEPSLRPMRRREIVRVKSLSALPSLFTLGNGVCGFAAIGMLAKAYTYIQLYQDTGVAQEMADAMHSMGVAVLYIVAAMVFDMLDGRIARMTGTEGRFGAELDSLCDAVSFGVAPAFFLRVFGEALFGRGIHSAEPGVAIRVLWAMAALYLCCTVLRLARFNVETDEDDDHTSFRGLPSPAAAGAVAALFLISWALRNPTTGEPGLAQVMTWALPACGGLFALLMVSRIRYPHLINRTLVGRRTMPQLVFVVLCLVGLFMLDVNMLALVGAGALLLFVALGPLGVVVTLGKKQVRASRRSKLIAERESRRQQQP